jgi:hypothetical protein
MHDYKIVKNKIIPDFMNIDIKHDSKLYDKILYKTKLQQTEDKVNTIDTKIQQAEKIVDAHIQQSQEKVYQQITHMQLFENQLNNNFNNNMQTMDNQLANIKRATADIPINKTIIVKHYSDVTNMVIEDFEYEFALKRRLRASDFNFIISKINEEICFKNSHRWFIHQFIFYTCYYTGIGPDKILLMTYNNMIDFIHGENVKIVDKYPLFTNKFVQEKMSFLIEYIPYLLPGGMVNSYNNPLTYRQLCKWACVYFRQLEMKNFGKLLSTAESYKLYDFKTTIMFRMTNSGMSLDDISFFMHHKNISSTEFHLKRHNLIYEKEYITTIVDELDLVEIPNTIEPVETPKHRNTVEPVKTPKPRNTVEPVETPKPRNTVEPVETPKPRNTVEQVETPKTRNTIEPGENKSQETLQTASNSESTVNRVVNMCDMIVEDFDYAQPLKKLIRKTDFDFIVSQIDEHHVRGSHQWFIHQYIFHICYYSGIGPKLLLTLNREDIIDYINGTFTKFTIFTNTFVRDKFKFLVPYIDGLLPGGMVNRYGTKLTYRQLSKWVEIYFRQLEMKNFGKLLPLDESYKLYDFKSMLLFRLHNSGMNISDISMYMHHKNICTTEQHLLSRNLIYNHEFKSNPN